MTISLMLAAASMSFYLFKWLHCIPTSFTCLPWLLFFETWQYRTPAGSSQLPSWIGPYHRPIHAPFVFITISLAFQILLRLPITNTLLISTPHFPSSAVMLPRQRNCLTCSSSCSPIFLYSCTHVFFKCTALGSDRRSSSDRRSEPNPNPIPNPNPSRSEPINFSSNSLLSFKSPIWTYNYPFQIVVPFVCCT